MQVTTHAAGASDDAADAPDVKQLPFLYLTVDVPAAPLFKDALERNIIPQAPRRPTQLLPESARALPGVLRRRRRR